MRIVFMGTSEFSVPTLKRLIASEYQLPAVYTQPDKRAGRGRDLSPPPVKRVALETGLDVRQPMNLREASVVDSLAQLRPDAIVVAAYGKILPDSVLAVAPFGCINVHPSLLPRHRGPSPVVGALLAGDDRTGVTIMLLDSGVDSGPLLAQKEATIEPTDTAESLAARLACLGADVLMETLPQWLSGSVTPRPQNEDEATYTQVLSKHQGEMEWNLPASDLCRRVRAFNPWPGCYTKWHGKVLKVIEVACLPRQAGEPGRVVPLPTGGVGVQASDGVLQLVTVQLEGKRRMSGEEFVRGQRDFAGALLPS